ncbi:MAG: hypothetical protein EA367_15060 [Leptolyngbya sp. DLM2.Bin15]|nr:MAG: hypothetical protein EA367_15060 [Leptolyngbya sp. DLM2.Bin15]
MSVGSVGLSLRMMLDKGDRTMYPKSSVSATVLPFGNEAKSGYFWVKNESMGWKDALSPW